MYFIAAALLYVAFYFFGKKANESRAHKWYVPLPCYVDTSELNARRFEAHKQLYQSQFSKPTHTEGLSQGTHPCL